MTLNEFDLFHLFGGYSSTHPNISKLRLKSPVPHPPGIESAEGKAHAIARQGRALLIEVPGRLEIPRRPGHGRGRSMSNVVSVVKLGKENRTYMEISWKYDGNMMRL